MNLKKLQYLFWGILIGLILVGGIFASFQPTPKIIIDQKMKECIENGGIYNIFDYSLEENGSDYRMTCNALRKTLWSIKINK